MLLLSAILLPSASAQNGDIVIHQDVRIDDLLELYAAHVNAQEEEMGYRIQILAGTSRDEAYKVKANFSYKYGGYRSYLTYNSPYFKVRVGDFTERLEAYRFLQNIKSKFPGAFMVEQTVNLN